jgi:hypothetical protein
VHYYFKFHGTVVCISARCVSILCQLNSLDCEFKLYSPTAVTFVQLLNVFKEMFTFAMYIANYMTSIFSYVIDFIREKGFSISCRTADMFHIGIFPEN